MNETWTPAIFDNDGATLHERLVNAVRAGIASGELEPETRMPTHRDLAVRLGIGVGTVTKAYAEAERLGLLTSAVGRGTFVAPSARSLWRMTDAAEADPDMPVDLSLNLQSLAFAAPRIGDALARLRLRPDLAETLGVVPHAGFSRHRQVLAGWFREAAHFDRIDWQRTLITTGTQHAMALIVGLLVQPGDVVLTEPATFSGFRALVDARGGHCIGVAMDDEGVRPDALEQAVRETGSRLLYLIPTLQNPTTRTMSQGRREEIARVARVHDLMLIEDDVYGPLAFADGVRRLDLTPVATFAPERTFYLSSASKVIAMGMRVGILHAPTAAWFDRLAQAMRVDCYAASSLAPMVVCQLIADGAADEIRRAVAQEAGVRMALAQRMLGTSIEEPSFASSLHAWMPMPELQAERVLNGALRRGVILTPPSSFIVDGVQMSGLRLCLNTVERPELERALRGVRSALADEIVPSRMAIV
ncbi:MAG: PLP-dependent aminotransferase family protein [Thermomicrobiales bacterium]